MILLESHNVIIQTTLAEKFTKPSSLDVQFVDFDGVRFHLSTPDRKTLLVLSMSMRCWPELVQYGANDILEREYGQYLSKDVESQYNVTLQIDTDQIPPEGDAREALIKSISLIKRNALAAPFERAFQEQKAFEAQGDGLGKLMAIHYRDEEAIYVQAAHDRVTVVFSTVFKEETDRVFGKVFLQEFVDARRLPTIQNAPQVLYSSRDPPLEIRDVQGLAHGDDIGYVTFVLFPRHFQRPDIAESTISHIQLFRDYLHYHIKCSKAYMHSRMRHRVSEFQKVLNRAKTEVATTEKKTISGRTMASR
ncbi:arp2/3 complex 34 kDa subunit [Hysterangium stoloniferum]|nr:arp2/3 complex 34 kDa subunit [Hysterangium stoloniferum]